MLKITKREAAQIGSGRRHVISRAMTAPKIREGVKVPVYVEPKQPCPFVLDIIGTSKQTVGQMTDAKAREEGFDDLGQWKSHWASLYRGTIKVNPETEIYRWRFRKGAVVHERRHPVDE